MCAADTHLNLNGGSTSQGKIHHYGSGLETELLERMLMRQVKEEKDSFQVDQRHIAGLSRSNKTYSSFSFFSSALIVRNLRSEIRKTIITLMLVSLECLY